MRLSSETQQAITGLFQKYFPEGRLYLFGSRVDDQARGGDIDLLCEQAGDPDILVKKKIAFLVELEKVIGEQKVDFIIYRPEGHTHSSIAEIAKKTGVRLV